MILFSLIALWCSLGPSLVPNPTTQPPPDNGVGKADFRYPTGYHPNQYVEVHLGEPFGPTLVWIHGGGWQGGSPSLSTEGPLGSYNHIPRRLHSAGWTVVSVGYRFIQDAPWPAQKDDVQLALDAITEHSYMWGIDPDRIIVGGFSAGGHLAAIVGNTTDTRLEGILSADGNTSASTFAAVDPGATQSTISDLLRCGGYSRCNQDSLRALDAETYSTPDDPPLYSIVADHSIIPLEVQMDARRAMQRGGQRVHIDVIDTGPISGRQHDHRGLNWDALTKWLEERT